MKKGSSWRLATAGVLFWLSAGVECGEAKLNYPVKPIEMIVAYPAGGGQDVNMRILAKHVEKYARVRVVVINKVGGGGVVGTTEMARAKPDGYTLGTLHTGAVTDELTIKGLPYTHKSFIPVMRVGADPHLLVIRNSLNMDFKQFIEFVKKSPGKVAIGVGGTWTTHDFLRVKMEKGIGLQFLRTPFQGGAPAVQAVAGGHIDCSTPLLPEGLPSIEGKLVTPIANSGSERSPAVPNIPTIKELGYNIVETIWRGISVPPGTPGEVITFLEDAFVKACQDPDFQKDLRKAGGTPSCMNRKEFTKFYQEEFASYSQMIQDLGIVPK
jgi:tripartite-type tricarboxylate transporter receptor subunit TctC